MNKPPAYLVALALCVVAYFAIYWLGFDRSQPAYSSDFSELLFQSSPKWVHSEIFNDGYTKIGKRASLSNYLFFPAEYLWRCCSGR